MPGTRQCTTGLPRKSSVQALKSRISTRPSSLSADVPDEGPQTHLRSEICNIFANAQRDTTTQRKLVVSLRKVQEACCYEPVKPQKHKKKSKAGRGGLGADNSEDDGEDAFGEQDFNEEVGRCVLRVLTVRKSEPVGDRIVKFLGLFLNYASEKDNTLSKDIDGDTTDVYAETPSSRLTSHILLLLLPLLSVKDKTVRFRATQITAHIINTLESIDDDLFQKMRVGLLRRIHDKETAVRVQAVLGLGRLAGEGDADDDDDDSGNRDVEDSNIDDSSINATGGRGGSSSGVLERLIEALQHDPAAEVRRSLLLNLPLVPATLPLLLERARDVDPGARRGLYAKLLPSLGDFRHLSLTHREKLLRWGLRDRDESVRKATARLFRERWVEDCAGTNAAAAEGGGEEANGHGNGGAVQQPAITKPDYDALLELLERIDIVNSGIEGGVAIEAMQHFWEGRPDYCDFVTFDGAFWDVLTPESAFVARTFNTFCRNSDSAKYQAMVDDKLPEVTRFAFILQKQIGTLIELVRKCATAAAADEEGENNKNMEMEEDMVQHEFAVEQLLHIALRLDYTDEIGRRKMFSVMRESLALAELPEECTKLVVEILRIVCGNAGPGEREFCSIVLEAIAEVHDTIMGEDEDEQQRGEGAETASTQEGDESFHSARSEVSDGDGTPTTKTNRSAIISRLDAGDETDATGQEDEEKAIKEIMVNMKCLHIAQCMLQNVQCVLEQNSHLAIMVDNLVIPAVRSQEAPIRERGLVCLGLCCLLSKTLANENLNLFIHCFSKGHEALQIIALEIISDILLTHPTLLTPLPPAPSISASQVDGADASTATATTTITTKSQQPSQLQPQPSPYERPVLKMYSRALKSADSGVQSTGATALCKLMLAQVIREPELLRQLVLAYFDPDTSANATLRQALAYFLPVYCHSRASNTARMLSIVVPALHVLAGAAEEADGQDEDMVGLTVVAGHFAEWTDARRVVVRGQNNEEEEEKKICAEIAEAAVAVLGEALEKFCSSGASKQERKALTAFLSKLYFPPPPTLSPENLAPLLDLLAETTDSRFVPDTTTRNSLVKLHQSLSKYLPSLPTPEDGDGDETIRDVSATSASASAAGREGNGNANSNANGDGDSRRESLAVAETAAESRRPSGSGSGSGSGDSDAGVGDVRLNTPMNSGSVNGNGNGNGNRNSNSNNSTSSAAAAAAEGANTEVTMMTTTTTTTISIADPDAEGTVIGDETMATM